ncbi:AraC family transcriptional regulator [Roseovarius sp. MMSF_3305]|nr:AraC family transcriptional regulator [Roseovarius sp. MMSF_3305]
MRANLRGQVAYEATLQGHQGLIVEVRLDGVSRTREIGGSRCAELGAGSVEITACPSPALWHVTAPAQESFRTVAMACGDAFLDALNDSDSELAERCHTLMHQEGISIEAATPYAICLAQRLLDIDHTAPSAKLSAAGCAMELLAEVLPKVSMKTTEDDRIEFALNYIAQNPGADVTISQIARAARMSPTSLKSLFRASQGRSIGAVMKEKRLQLARRMLSTGTGLKDVAHCLNYSGAETLARALRQSAPSELSE